MNDCIVFSKNSWHKRIYEWGLGFDGSIYNLCPYVRALMAIILTSPVIAFYKILPVYCTIYHQTETKFFLIIGVICSIIHIQGILLFAWEWWWVSMGVIIMTSIILIITGLLFLAMFVKDKLDDRPKSEKVSLVKEYMIAKHDKICPCIEWSNE